jgi:hypothetical protein
MSEPECQDSIVYSKRAVSNESAVRDERAEH